MWSQATIEFVIALFHMLFLLYTFKTFATQTASQHEIGVTAQKKFNSSLMTVAVKACRIITTIKVVIKGGIHMLLILALIGIALDVPREIVGSLLVIFLVRELA